MVTQTEIEKKKKRLEPLDFAILFLIPPPLSLFVLLIKWGKRDESKPQRAWPYIVAIAASLSAVAAIVVLIIVQPFRPRATLDYYSDDSHFGSFAGTIVECSSGKDGQGVFSYRLEMVDYVYFKGDEPLYTIDIRTSWTICSPNVEGTWNRLNPYPGLKLRFKGVPLIFLDGNPNGIVELVREDETVLTFDEGKAALLKWAKETR